MVFSYYHRLNRRQKAIYRASDRWDEVDLSDPQAARSAAADIEKALLADIAPAAQRYAVRQASNRLVRILCDQLEVEPVDVRVLARRPRSAESELHGLYVWEQGQRAEITVWMRTAQRKQVVAFKTFLRTLLHEICHHLDFHLLELSDSYHTEGFFRRENHLTRQLLPNADSPAADQPAVAAAAPSAPQTPPARGRKSAAKQRSSAQLKLPF